MPVEGVVWSNFLLKIQRGTLIGADAKIPGYIKVRVGAKGVVRSVLPYALVVGVPARPVGTPHTPSGVAMNQSVPDDQAI